MSIGKLTVAKGGVAVRNRCILAVTFAAALTASHAAAYAMCRYSTVERELGTAEQLALHEMMSQCPKVDDSEQKIVVCNFAKADNDDLINRGFYPTITYEEKWFEPETGINSSQYEFCYMGFIQCINVRSSEDKVICSNNITFHNIDRQLTPYQAELERQRKESKEQLQEQKKREYEHRLATHSDCFQLCDSHFDESGLFESQEACVERYNNFMDKCFMNVHGCYRGGMFSSDIVPEKCR